MTPADIEFGAADLGLSSDELARCAGSTAGPRTMVASTFNGRRGAVDPIGIKAKPLFFRSKA
jgi:hypothetical protein